jgi:hypothetical protein
LASKKPKLIGLVVSVYVKKREDKLVRKKLVVLSVSVKWKIN